MSAAMAVLMAGSLAACGSSASSAADSNPASTASSADATAESSDAPVTIRITWWGSQSRHDYTQAGRQHGHPRHRQEWSAVPPDGG